MNKKITTILILLGLLVGGTVYAARSFFSFQVGETPTAGDVLQTNGSISTWVATSTLGIIGSSPLTTKGDVYTYSTADARLPVGANGKVLTASSTAVTGLTWATASGSQSPWTSNIDGAGYNLTNVGTATGTSAIFDTFTGYLTGNVNGTASTSQALLANGANCTAGSYPLGVDASGASESCTDATTEIDSALAAFTGSTNVVTVGTIATGVWNSTKIDNAYVASSTEYLADNDTTYLGGTNLTLDGTTFNVDDAFVLNTSDTMSGNLDVTGTTTSAYASITSGISLMGEYFTNFTNYVRSLFTGGSHVTITSGSIAVDDDFLLNNGDTGTGTYNLSGAIVKQHTYKTFTYPGVATTTTATTTLPLGTAFTAEAWNTADCYVTSGTADVIFSDGTNLMNGFNATTTVGTFTLSTNNTFTAHEKRQVAIGALTAAQLSCTVDVTINN